MGISTLESYQGAQIFEPLGIAKEVVDTLLHRFTQPNRRPGIQTSPGSNWINIPPPTIDETTTSRMAYHWRVDGEYHHMNPHSITALQRACREGDYEHSKPTAACSTKMGDHCVTYSPSNSVHPSPLSEVESVERIHALRHRRHELWFHLPRSTQVAIMNRIGGKSNSGEGGEDAIRYTAKANGDNECSAIKQIASGRFGEAHYLTNAIELQIKMAQGAKPGEGGHLPTTKSTIGLGECANARRWTHLTTTASRHLLH